jgi:hypothetical protein
MTQNKVQKAAIRRRMAETGEPYVVARRIVLGEASGAGSDVDRLMPLEAQDAPGTQEVSGASATGGVQEARGAAGTAAVTPEEQYVLEARAAGVGAEEIESQTVVYRLEAAAQRAQEAAERARELADRAEEEAEQTEDRAGRAEEAAEEAEEWAEPAEKRLLRERAARLQEAWEQAQLRAEQAEEVAVAAEERAELAADAAEEAANDEFSGPADDDPRSVWAAATGDGFAQADRAGPWAGDEEFVPPVPPAPPVPPMPPVPPRPPVPPAFRW